MGVLIKYMLICKGNNNLWKRKKRKHRELPCRADILRDGYTVIIGYMGCWNDVWISFNLIPTLLIVSQDHPNSPCLSSHITFGHSCINPNKANHNLPIQFGGIKCSLLTNFPVRIQIKCDAPYRWKRRTKHPLSRCGNLSLADVF